jgi:hypothetical protein
MKLETLKADAVVGRWIYYRRAAGWWRAELRRAYVQSLHAGEIVALSVDVDMKPTFPQRPPRNPCPLLLPLDELEIHAVVEASDPVPPSPSV